jgi:hypothetical protein
MKLKYGIPVKEGSSVTFSSPTTLIEIDPDTKLTFETDSNRVLTKIVIEISNQKIKYDQDGCIITKYQELDDELFRIITYISNSIYIQTTIDAIDTHKDENYSPEPFPETFEEKQEFATKKKIVTRSIKFAYNVQGSFNIKEFTLKLSCTEPVAHYANAIRTVSLLQKYEQFYKVIECFFGDKLGDKFDKAVSSHAYQYDKMYDDAKIKELRELRIRLVHPKPRKLKHLSPEDFQAFHEVEKNLNTINKLAKLLLDNAPQV